MRKVGWFSCIDELHRREEHRCKNGIVEKICQYVSWLFHPVEDIIAMRLSVLLIHHDDRSSE